MSYLSNQGMQRALLSDVKSAWMIEEWTEETTLRKLETELNVSPGDVHHRVDLMGWLLAGRSRSYSPMMCLRKSIFPLWPNLSSRSARCSNASSWLQIRPSATGQHPTCWSAASTELAALGMREPKDVANMSARHREALLSKRGWGPILLDKIHAEIERVLKKSGASKNKKRTTTPLEGERLEHD